MAAKKFYTLSYEGKIKYTGLSDINPDCDKIVICAENIPEIYKKVLISEQKYTNSFALLDFKKTEIIRLQTKVRNFVLFAVCDPIVGRPEDIRTFCLRTKGKIIGINNNLYPLNNYIKIEAVKISFYVKMESVDNKKFLYMALDE